MRERRRTDPLRTVALLLTLLAAALRLWGSGEKSLWVDEAQALWVAEHEPAWIVEHCSRLGSHESPARHLLMHWLAGIAPNRASAIRLPALIGGIALVPLLWGLGATLGGRAAGFFAALLCALSPVMVEHSQDARHYTVMLALEFGGLLALLAAWRRPWQWGLWIAAGAASALAFYVSFTAAFVVGAVGLTLLLLLILPLGVELTERDALRRGALIGIVSLAIPLLPWAMPIARAVAQYVGLLSPPPPEVMATGVTALGERFVPEWSSRWTQELLHPTLWGSLLMAVGVLIGLWSALRHQPRHLVPLVLIGLLTLGLTMGTAMRHSLAPRYLLHLHALALTLCGVALGTLWRMGLGGAIGSALAAAALTLGFLPTLWTCLTTERQDWRGAVEIIESNFQPHDIILTGAYWSERPVQHYIAEPQVAAAVRPHVMAEADFEMALMVHSSVWYIGWGEIPPFIQEHLDREFTLIARLPGTRGDVFVYKRGPLPSPAEPEEQS
ncbi:glycosyltransferase family 39 protein [Candidatus Sumerlaeota bacterium]|nr:glycosyltransferase family 39 protein [Candidatus Sumerlaeota bacterium]